MAWKNGLQNIFMKDPGRAKQKSQGTVGESFTKPRTSHFFGPCIVKLGVTVFCCCLDIFGFKPTYISSMLWCNFCEHCSANRHYQPNECHSLARPLAPRYIGWRKKGRAIMLFSSDQILVYNVARSDQMLWDVTWCDQVWPYVARYWYLDILSLYLKTCYQMVWPVTRYWYI